MARGSDSTALAGDGPTPDEIVARETPQRKLAAYLAWGAAFMTALSVLVNALSTQGQVPAKSTAIGINQALSLQERGLAIGSGYTDRYVTLLLHHSFITVLIQVFGAIALILAAPLVLLLLRAARVRGGSVPRFLDAALMAGTAVIAISEVFVAIVRLHGFQHAKNIGLTPGSVSDALGGGALLAGQAAETIGFLLLAFVYFVAAFQSQRVGLLPRWIGFFGVGVAILFVVAQNFDPFGIPRAFWLAITAWALVGRLRAGLPQAWAEGISVAPQPPQPRPPRRPRGAEPVAATPEPIATVAPDE